MNDKLPWFKFYPFDWVSDSTVQTMTLIERGFYMEILCRVWIENGIPNNRTVVERLFNACSTDDEQPSSDVKKRSVDLIFDLLEVTPDGRKLTHWKLEEQREDLRNRAKKASEAGKKSGEARRKKQTNNRLTNVERTLNKPEPEPEPEVLKKKYYKKENNHPESKQEIIDYFTDKGMDTQSAGIQAIAFAEYYDPEQTGRFRDRNGKLVSSWKRNAATWFANWSEKQTRSPIKRMNPDKTNRQKPEITNITKLS